MTDETQLLRVEDLCVDLPTVSGLLSPVRSVSLSVARNETLAIVGESGSGKSLTATAILGLLPRSARVRSRAIELDGTDLTRLGARALRRLRGDRIAMIFQDPMTALDPCYRVGDQMVEILRQHRRISRKDAMERARGMLAQVGIPAPETRLRQFPHQLSGGLRQRVVIAMALLCEPDLIIADEPTTALDVTIQAQILSLLKSLQERTGFGLILITHDFGVVAGMADRIAVMYGGEVVETGPCDELLEAPLHPDTEGLLQALPSLRVGDGPLGLIPGVVPRQVGPRLACGFVDRCPYAETECSEHPVQMREQGFARATRCILPSDRPRDDRTVWHRQMGEDK